MKKLKDYLIILRSDPRLLLLFFFTAICVIIFIALILIIFGARPTNETTVLSNTQQKEVQQQADETFNKVIESTQNKYPWFDNLPPKNDKYFVAFDEAEQAFYVSLYIKNNPSLTDSYKEQVYLDLEKIGVATESYKFNWFTR
jgi:hypothetical protein